MTSLLEQYQALQTENPRLRARDAAQTLGISEAQLLDIQSGEHIFRLQPRFADLLKKIKGLGTVMALTRNNAVVHELTGQYEKLYVNSHGDKEIAIAINPGGIDLRLFLYKWHSAYAQITDKHLSIQFFDRTGTAVQKIFSTQASNIDAFHQLITEFKAIEPQPLQLPAQPTTPIHTLADEAVDINALRADWQQLQDVHDFPKMLEKHQVGRLQALNLIGNQWAQPLSMTALEVIMNQVRDDQIEIMVFVGNAGAVQIFSGYIDQLKWFNHWFNVLDSDFNLHVDTEQLAHAWLVHKPTDKGQTIISSVEFFDAQGETLLTLFGRRDEGKSVNQDWQSLLTDTAKKYALEPLTVQVA